MARMGVPKPAGGCAGNLGEILQPELFQVDTGIPFEAVDDRIAKSSLVGEVPVNRALVDTGQIGHGPDGYPAPVPDGRPGQEIGARRDDAVARLYGPGSAERAVV